jgi:hypothetical protein
VRRHEAPLVDGSRTSRGSGLLCLVERISTPERSHPLSVRSGGPQGRRIPGRARQASSGGTVAPPLPVGSDPVPLGRAPHVRPRPVSSRPEARGDLAHDGLPQAAWPAPIQVLRRLSSVLCQSKAGHSRLTAGRAVAAALYLARRGSGSRPPGSRRSGRPVPAGGRRPQNRSPLQRRWPPLPRQPQAGPTRGCPGRSRS